MNAWPVGLLWIAALAFDGAAPPSPPAAMPWGVAGHEMAARAAVESLPESVPTFFRGAADQLVFLNPEPDRWRDRRFPEGRVDEAYDHYIDLENVPAGALDEPDRYAFLRRLYEADIERPERDVGFLPFRIVEVYQRLVGSWTRWRSATDPVQRGWIEARIVDDAGALGHYVTDGSQPHHTTIHFNGWAEGSSNPGGFTTDRSFHARFESLFVDAHVTPSDVSERVVGPPRSVAGGARAAVIEYLMTTHEEVEPLYELEQRVGFDPSAAAAPAARTFAATRLAAGADMLRVLWWSAWLESAG